MKSSFGGKKGIERTKVATFLCKSPRRTGQPSPEIFPPGGFRRYRMLPPGSNVFQKKNGAGDVLLERTTAHPGIPTQARAVLRVLGQPAPGDLGCPQHRLDVEIELGPDEGPGQLAQAAQ